MDFDPAPIWAKVKVPVLLLKGGNDAKSDAAIARREIEKALAQAENRPEFVLFPEADHALLQWPLGERIPPPVFAPGYIERLKWWLRQRKCAAD